MNCPLLKKCHADLVAERDAYSEALHSTANDAQVRIGNLQLEVSALQAQLEQSAMKFQALLPHLSMRGRRSLSGYQNFEHTRSVKPAHGCWDCEFNTPCSISRNRKHRCAQFDHTIDRRNGSCPNHPILKLQESSK